MIFARIPYYKAISCVWIVACMTFNVAESQNSGTQLFPADLDRQLQNMNPIFYQLHAAALLNQIREILNNERYLYQENLEDSNALNDDEIIQLENQKRYIGSLLKSGLVNSKRSLATLAKNGQLPTQEPDDGTSNDFEKRNIATLARDYQLPTMGKRSYIPSFADPRVRSTLGKRNLGALKGSPVHGNRQKRFDSQNELESFLEFYGNARPRYYDSVNYDNNENLQEEKRFLGRILPPTRATSTTSHRVRL